MASKDIYVLIPGSCEYVIYITKETLQVHLKSLGWGEYPELSQWAKVIKIDEVGRRDQSDDMWEGLPPNGSFQYGEKGPWANGLRKSEKVQKQTFP